MPTPKWDPPTWRVTKFACLDYPTPAEVRKSFFPGKWRLTLRTPGMIVRGGP